MRETQRAGPSLNFGQQLGCVEMGAEVDHAVIVKTLRWRDEAATQLFASRLAAQPGLRHAFIELRGELGTGKTTLVRHLLRALGVTGRITSPT